METPNALKSKSVFDTRDTSAPRLTPTNQSMSASLKERLKRTRRSFNSPFTVAKRLRINAEAQTDLKAPTVSPEAAGAQDRGETDSNNKDVSWESAEVTGVCRNRPAQRSCTGMVTEATHGTSCLTGVEQSSQSDLFHLRDRLKREVREKEETLRRLKMVQMYRTKNDLDELQCLVNKWRSCSQAVLYELQSALSTDGSKLSLTQLIDHFGLEEHILHYNRTEEDFTDV
ncbi:swi5-dependent recombination DNA repair protein 1 homolog [Amia ocellicauda]|uniref:swi5-dependent recombination DNA repair protein 1 homolog n=1 Tax=Amia ocellicauda TaxID=2972642 RepID=UPI003463869C